MIKVIGKKSCSRCDMTKNILNNKNIPYEYLMLEDVSQEDKAMYLKMAREAKQMEMPLIIKDNIVVNLQEVM